MSGINLKGCTEEVLLTSKDTLATINDSGEITIRGLFAIALQDYFH